MTYEKFKNEMVSDKITEKDVRRFAIRLAVTLIGISSCITYLVVDILNSVFGFIFLLLLLLPLFIVIIPELYSDTP